MDNHPHLIRFIMPNFDEVVPAPKCPNLAQSVLVENRLHLISSRITGRIPFSVFLIMAKSNRNRTIDAVKYLLGISSNIIYVVTCRQCAHSTPNVETYPAWEYNSIRSNNSTNRQRVTCMGIRHQCTTNNTFLLHRTLKLVQRLLLKHFSKYLVWLICIDIHVIPIS